MKKKMHPLQIFHAMVEIIRQNIFLIFILFVLNYNSDRWLMVYGKWAFIIFLLGTFIFLIISWFVTTYEFKNQTAHMYRGVFKKRHTSVPLYRVQNLQRKTPFYFKIFGVTTLTLETGIQQDGADLSFDAVSLEEAGRIEQLLDDYRAEKRAEEAEDLEEGLDPEAANTLLLAEGSQASRKERKVHFTPTKKEVLKASFLSFSFLAIIPLAITAFIKLEDLIDVEEQMSGIFAVISKSWLSISLTIIAVLIVAIVFGIIYAYLRYGKYEVSSDQNRIYIRSGVLTEKSFSIQKDRIQAVQINQPFLKKLLGLAEVRFISASTGLGEENDISSLYPFLPVKRAYSILGEILPQFHVLDQLERLPRESLRLKFLRIPWLVVFALGLLYFIGWKYWWILLIITTFVYVSRYFTYRNTRYKMEGPFIQFRVGGLSSTSFITTRRLVTEIEVEQGFLQARFGLLTIKTHNRTAHNHVELLEDVPEEIGEVFRNWYATRLEEIEIDSRS